MTQRKNKFSIDGQSNGFMAAYFPVNDPKIPLDRLDAYNAAKVDVIELGIKTENPYADGEIVAQSMMRASGIGTISEANDAIAKVRSFEHNPLGMIFGYAEEKLVADRNEWDNVDGLLALGEQTTEQTELVSAASNHGVRITEFVPYGMPQQALVASSNATGFVFLQYTDGKTGIRHQLDDELSSRVKRLKQQDIKVPIFAGVGISTTEQVRHAMDCGVDGIVVGSQTVLKAIEGQAALEDYLCSLRDVLNGR